MEGAQVRICKKNCENIQLSKKGFIIISSNFREKKAEKV